MRLPHPSPSLDNYRPTANVTPSVPAMFPLQPHWLILKLIANICVVRFVGTSASISKRLFKKQKPKN